MVTVTILVFLFCMLINYVVTEFRTSISFVSFIDNSSDIIAFPRRCKGRFPRSEKCDYILQLNFSRSERRMKTIVTKRFPKYYISSPIFDNFFMDFTEEIRLLNYNIELKETPTSCNSNFLCKNNSNSGTILMGNEIVLANFRSAQIISFRSDNIELLLVLQHGCKPTFFGHKCDVICRPRDDPLGHYKCGKDGSKRCLAGWKNPLLNCTEHAPCTPDWCKNGGQCYFDIKFQKSCNCSRDFYGKRCEYVKTPCDFEECVHGKCEVTNKTHRKCICPTEWTGESCHLNASICKSLSCINGECEVSNNVYYCKCPPTYTGDHCEEDVDECEQNPPVCHHDGICINTPGSYACSCGFPWHGIQCKVCMKAGKRMGICGREEKRPFASLQLTAVIVGILVVIPGFTFIFLHITKKNDDEIDKMTLYDGSSHEDHSK